MGSILWSKRHQRYTPVRKSRPKTFKTEQAAKLWADKKGIKSYRLVNLKSPESSTKKIRVVAVKQ